MQATALLNNKTYTAEVTTMVNGQQVATFQGPRKAWYTAFLRTDGGKAEVINMSLKTVGYATVTALA